MINSMIAGYNPTLPIIDFSLIERNRNRWIGKIGIFKNTELGIILHSSIWGKGYASEALDTSLSATPTLEYIVVDSDPSNAVL